MTYIPDGTPVPGPGQYEMSMEHYHSQACCPGVSVSSSGLRKILLESPADFWAFSDLNDDRFEKPSSEAFTFGRAAHALLLGDEDFHAKFAVVPASAPPKPLPSQIVARLEGRVSASAQERFDFWDEFDAETAGKELLSENDLTHIMRISEALKAHEIVPLLMEGQAEQSLIWEDEATGIWLKSRLDILSATGDLADLKSTAQKSPHLIKRDIGKHGYDMQLALGTMALENVLGVPFTPETYAGRAALLLFVYKQPPYHVMPIEIDFESLHYARIKCRAAIDRMYECLKSGVWPGPFDGILTYTTPAWEVEEITEKQSLGTYPRTSFGDYGGPSYEGESEDE